MLLFFCTTGLVFAQGDETTSFGFRVEHLPAIEAQEVNETIHPWIPWFIFGNQNWTLKGTFLTNSMSQQSKTSETFERTIFSQSLMGLEVERTILSGQLQWNIGAGIQSNIPIITQQSTQFTELEQETVNTQTESQEAELAFTRLRIPCTVQIPIQKHLNIGLGVQTSYTLQRSQSDFTTYFNTSWYTSPIVTIEIR